MACTWAQNRPWNSHLKGRSPAVLVYCGGDSSLRRAVLSPKDAIRGHTRELQATLQVRSVGREARPCVFEATSW